jgi:hypothetical protein
MKHYEKDQKKERFVNGSKAHTNSGTNYNEHISYSKLQHGEEEREYAYIENSSIMLGGAYLVAMTPPMRAEWKAEMIL